MAETKANNGSINQTGCCATRDMQITKPNRSIWENTQKLTSPGHTRLDKPLKTGFPGRKKRGEKNSHPGESRPFLAHRKGWRVPGSIFPYIVLSMVEVVAHMHHRPTQARRRLTGVCCCCVRVLCFADESGGASAALARSFVGSFWFTAPAPKGFFPAADTHRNNFAGLVPSCPDAHPQKQPSLFCGGKKIEYTSAERSWQKKIWHLLFNFGGKIWQNLSVEPGGKIIMLNSKFEE